MGPPRSMFFGLCLDQGPVEVPLKVELSPREVAGLRKDLMEGVLPLCLSLHWPLALEWRAQGWGFPADRIHFTIICKPKAIS